MCFFQLFFVMQKYNGYLRFSRSFFEYNMYYFQFLGGPGRTGSDLVVFRPIEVYQRCYYSSRIISKTTKLTASFTSSKHRKWYIQCRNTSAETQVIGIFWHSEFIIKLIYSMHKQDRQHSNTKKPRFTMLYNLI